MRFNKLRETIHYWLKKYRENGLDGLKTLLKTTEQQDQRIVAAGIEILFPLKNVMLQWPIHLMLIFLHS